MSSEYEIKQENEEINQQEYAYNIVKEETTIQEMCFPDYEGIPNVAELRKTFLDRKKSAHLEEKIKMEDRFFDEQTSNDEISNKNDVQQGTDISQNLLLYMTKEETVVREECLSGYEYIKNEPRSPKKENILKKERIMDNPNDMIPKIKSFEKGNRNLDIPIKNALKHNHQDVEVTQGLLGYVTKEETVVRVVCPPGYDNTINVLKSPKKEQDEQMDSQTRKVLLVEHNEMNKLREKHKNEISSNGIFMQCKDMLKAEIDISTFMNPNFNYVTSCQSEIKQESEIETQIIDEDYENMIIKEEPVVTELSLPEDDETTEEKELPKRKHIIGDSETSVIKAKLVNSINTPEDLDSQTRKFRVIILKSNNNNEENVSNKLSHDVETNIENVTMGSQVNSFINNNNNAVLRYRKMRPALLAERAMDQQGASSISLSRHRSPSLDVMIQADHSKIHIAKDFQVLKNTNGRPHSCSRCGKHFKKHKHLVQHLRIHSKQKPYTCMQCEKTFRQISHLSQHMLIHSGKKPYECSECGKHFRHRCVLNKHLRIHSGEKSHKCSHCGMYFRRSDTLSQHILIHSGEKPHKCSECGKQFRTNSNLNKHIRSHQASVGHAL